MWWNENSVEQFLTNFPDEYWEVRTIALSELGCKYPHELTADQLVALLDYIGIVDYRDDAELDRFNFEIKIKFDGRGAYYLLEMSWK